MLRHSIYGILLALGLLGSAQASVFTPEDLSQLLQRADSIKTSRHDEFLQLLNQLDNQASKLTPIQQWRLRYLHAWQVAFSGQYPEAGALLNDVIERSDDATLRFRANATIINILGIAHRYEDAFRHLNQLIDDLPEVTDKVARYQGLGEAAQLLIAAEQYDQAIGYAEEMLQDLPPGENDCKALYFKLHAAFRNGSPQPADPPFQEGIDACLIGKEPLFADTLRADIAALQITRNQPEQAIAILKEHYRDVLGYRYPALTMQYNVLLAKAYWKQSDIAQTEKFAQAVVEGAIQNEYTEPLSAAYSLLYQIEVKRGNIAAALDYHEKYMAADKGYLNDVTARTLAFQIVNQQLKARKLEVEALNKRNQILQLQRALDHKAVETSRLYILLLVTVLASIALLLYRIKRSQLRFMRLARQDGLTGIFNRQHFVEEAGHALRQAERGHRHCCLILIDLDHFKQINDTYGHAVGDQVLQAAVSACRAFLRSSDVFGRLGGEEFGILLPECTIATAIDRAEHLRRTIATIPVQMGERLVAVSASFGISSTERIGHDLQRLLVDADRALYRAKHSGRNRVESSGTGDGAPSSHAVQAEQRQSASDLPDSTSLPEPASG
ncbi:MAG TPA: GGDEF domain-containing protein [Dyella sp.]|uniref:GGDEF domain-containing protein n=1 Tax=Dyella sp. TaxID=1869338 RepID=UPI002F937EC6